MNKFAGWIFVIAFASSVIPQDKEITPFNRNFLVPDSGKSIILIGDTQTTSSLEFWRENNEGIRKIMFSKIAEENPEFVILLGDAVFQGSSENEWSEFNFDLKPLTNKNIPVFPVMGNHEFFGDNKSARQNYFSAFLHLNKAEWYSVVYGNTAFIMLNSNFDDLTKEEIDGQNKWLSAKLEEFDKDSTIRKINVSVHHPPFTNSKVVSDNLKVQEYFVPLFLNSQKTKIFFSGHCHSFEHFTKSGKHFIISGGGGPRQEVETDEKNQKHKDNYKGEKIRAFHFCRLVNSGNDIVIELVIFNSIKNNWEVDYRFTIK